MKLLLLSSNSFGFTHLAQFINKPLPEVCVAWVTTAGKGVSDRSYLNRHREEMEAATFSFEELDIEGKSPEELREAFVDKDVIWVDGGNTFYLLDAIRRSGFEEAVRERLEDGVLYVGGSAGAYVACPTIEMATWKREREFENTLSDLAAMRLVPFLVVAHYEPMHRKEVQQGVERSSAPVYVLTDDHALFIKDGNVRAFEGDREIGSRELLWMKS